jgi:hypothetical protein
MPLEELKNKIRNTVRSFNREYNTSIYFFPEDSTSVIHVQLVDLYHDMSLYLLISLNNLNILDLGIEENRVPYPICQGAIPAFQAYIGVNIMKVGKSKDLFPKTSGCLHLHELLEEAAQNFNTGYAFFLKEQEYPKELNEEKMFIKGPDREYRREVARHWWMKDKRVKNSCYSFATIRENTEAKKLIEDVPGFTQILLSKMKKKKD